MEQAFMLTMTIMMTLLFFVVGGIVGWIANRTFLENQPINMHPEFFDNDGNIIPDEILAVRFENDYDSFEEDDE
jgi:hypothetical protein|tara:strand:+ start:210 stop:431 length:222 start_codon:yes stop_codon:yes gene_type:complete